MAAGHRRRVAQLRRQRPVRALAGPRRNYAYAVDGRALLPHRPPLQGVNPPKAPRPPPLRADVPCETQEPPDLRTQVQRRRRAASRSTTAAARARRSTAPRAQGRARAVRATQARTLGMSLRVKAPAARPIDASSPRAASSEARDPQAPPRTSPRSSALLVDRPRRRPATSCSNQRLRFPLIEEKPFALEAEFQTAQAVTPGQGQTVRVSGVRIGDISKVELEDGPARHHDGPRPQVRGPRPQRRDARCCGPRPG